VAHRGKGVFRRRTWEPRRPVYITPEVVGGKIARGKCQCGELVPTPENSELAIFCPGCGRRIAGSNRFAELSH